MNATSWNVTLPEPMKAFVESQAAEGGYATPDDYLCALIQEAQRRKARQTVEAMLVKGLRSELSPMTPQDWEDIRREGSRWLRTEPS
jgi:antitoxin ParD1/3/4